MTFGNGFVVLETRSKLVDFLLAVVSRILTDLDLIVLTPAPPPVIPILNTNFQWESSAGINTMRPYTAPPAFSIDDISALINSQYELAAQHLDNLRTDPMYLAETVRSYYDHRIETILNRAPPSLIQSRATTLILTDAYSLLAYYYIAKPIIAEFRVVQKSFPNGVAHARELPKEYEDALMKLHPVFKVLVHRVSKVHHQTICASPALRDNKSHELAFTPKRGDKLFTYLTVLLQEDQTHLWQLMRCGKELFDLGLAVVAPFRETRTNWAALGIPNWVGAVQPKIQTAFAHLNFELQKIRGSAWTFRHPNGRRSVTGESLIFDLHEPHPEATMRFWEARRFGRRLTKRFGWTLDSFLVDFKMT
ncbi:hypothetical protein C8R44DRAFT_931272 [Mycena epipterygia]|nr:hypothetical protein C8R44DRAFT_931272 [Mycena epipterygia]